MTIDEIALTLGLLIVAMVFAVVFVMLVLKYRGKAIVLLLFMASTAGAQTSVSVDINKAKLTWQWAQGTGGVADGFKVKCGNTSGNYSRITTLSNPAAREVFVKDAITGSGQWFCIATAFNQFGESAGTNEVSFFAGVGPSSPTNLIIEAQ